MKLKMKLVIFNEMLIISNQQTSFQSTVKTKLESNQKFLQIPFPKP